MADARKIAVGVKLTDLLSQMELTSPAAPSKLNPLLAPSSDTQLKRALPAKK
jgi:hypothetical protein